MSRASRAGRRPFTGLVGLFFLLTLLTLTACGTGATPEQGQQPEADRVIKHAMGETKVSAHPQRVIVMDSGELDNAIALGVIPVGATYYSDKDEPLLSYAQDITSKITLVGSLNQPNLAQIAALDPDLILGSKLRHEKIYQQLSEIAPTVFSVDVGVSWKANLKLHAEALNKTKEADELMNKYYARLDEFKKQVQAKGKVPTISVLRIYPTNVRAYQKASFSGTILSDAGLQRPPFSDKNEFAGEVGFENLSELDADMVFVTQYGIKSQALEDLTKRPQWQALGAVKQQKVFTVSDHIWIRGIGIGGARLLVEDLFTYILK